MLDIPGLHVRAALFRYIREFFSERDFLEVDTPVRQPVLIPEYNIIPVAADGQYLQTSPELCMKRLLAMGCTRIFQICPCFRKHERGRNHLEEFTMLEWYRNDEDYHQLMVDCEELLKYIVARIGESGDQQLWTGLRNIHAVLAAPAERLTVADAFVKYSPVSLEQALQGDLFDEVLVENIEPHLGKNRPLFLMDYPRQLASLARVAPGNPLVAERFELYVMGIELANGFTELTDPDEQRERFVAEIKDIQAVQKRDQGMPERFLDDLSQLEGAAGIALGFDRLLMLISGKTDISEVVSFYPGDFL